ncbi:acyltransferase family protein [Streptomyces hainanensis]|uniref:acyltransferase family protein n=1 Tax=Streptomyces hainanensis TaxID=402648 RepID=UPI00140493FD|nr:acyltransferase family protein [Streptomyces hainanensis]
MPTAVYVGTATVAVVVCLLVSVDRRVLGELGWALALQLWFLPLYLLLVLLTPLLLALYRRVGLWLLVVFVALAAVVDVLVFGPDIPVVGTANYLFVWGGMFLLGFAWHDGALRGIRPLLMIVVGAVAWVLLVTVGPFPISLIGVPGARIENDSPPSLALFSYALVAIGLLVLAEPAANRWLRNPRRWRRVSAGNRTTMGLYLWHMAPAMAAAAVIYPLGLFPDEAPGTGAWWLLRLAWVILLAALLVPLIVLVSLVPRPPARAARHQWGTGAWITLLVALGAVGYALEMYAIHGFAPSGHFPWHILLPFAAGVLLVVVACGRERRGATSVEGAGPVT